jgi:polyisoprenoid-binding protein YceI
MTHSRTLALFVLPALLACNTDPTKGKAQATTSAPAAAAPAAPSAAPSAALVELPLSKSSGTISFVGAKISDKHAGNFADFSGKISLSPGSPEGSKVAVTIPIASMVIEPAKLKGHLLTPDFFDVEKFPTASFESTSIAKSGDKYSVTGNLTLHGVTKAITFPAAITAGSDSASIKTEFGINRKDFGIVYPGMPDDLIQDQVLIQLDLKATKG